MVQLRTVAVACGESLATGSMAGSVGSEPLDGFHSVEDPGSHRPSVHAEGSTDCAGDTLEELEPGEAEARGHATELLEASAAADAQAEFTEHLDATPCLRG
jgi:hypothetical protein